MYLKSFGDHHRVGSCKNQSSWDEEKTEKKREDWWFSNVSDFQQTTISQSSSCSRTRPPNTLSLSLTLRSHDVRPLLRFFIVQHGTENIGRCDGLTIRPRLSLWVRHSVGRPTHRQWKNREWGGENIAGRRGPCRALFSHKILVWNVRDFES